MGCVCHPWVLSDGNMGGSAELWLTMDETGFIEPVGVQQWVLLVGSGEPAQVPALGHPHFLLF